MLTADPQNTRFAEQLLSELFPICRSITGPGVRATLNRLAKELPMRQHCVASGAKVFDWVVPDEWRIADAYVTDEAGRRVIDFQANNLHVMSYSEPVDRVLSFDELDSHLHTMPTLPEAIPYRTSYYKRAWGFCIAHRQYMELDRNTSYRAVIESEFTKGELNYGEAFLNGTTNREILISTYVCHPSMANDNLTGPIMAILMYNYLASLPERKFCYRFVFAPETIGAIAYMSRNTGAMRRSEGGFVLTTCGGPGPIGFKETFLGDHWIDRAIRVACKGAGVEPIAYPFVPDGSDERQYSSPGFRIPVATITKDKYYEYEFYHTSLDNLDFVSGRQIAETFELYRSVLDIIESDIRFVSRFPEGEVQLGRRGMYPSTGGAIKQGSDSDSTDVHAIDHMTWLLFLADGDHTLLDVAEHTGYTFSALKKTLHALEKAGLVDLITSESDHPPNFRVQQKGPIR